VVFLTLTLPADQIHSDNEIKRSALMPFFQQLKRVSGVEEYFWSWGTAGEWEHTFSRFS